MPVSLKPAIYVSAIENLNTCSLVKAHQQFDLDPYEWFVLRLTK